VSDQSKKTVRFDKLWTEPLLERLAVQISVRTASLESVGDPTNLPHPSHYAYDTMLPLAHASEIEPFGWVLFGAKYLNAPWAVQALRARVVSELADSAYSEEVARRVVMCYCTGEPMSARGLRRTLEIGRRESAWFCRVKDQQLSHFHAVESEYARLVRKFL
jgi:hypothetical protein